MLDKSIIMPPSHTAWPATPWPPPRTATRSAWSRAKFTAAITSATPWQRTISLGRLSIIPFQMPRVVSYSGAPGCNTSPRRVSRSASRAVSGGIPPVPTYSVIACPFVVTGARERADPPSLPRLGPPH